MKSKYAHRTAGLGLLVVAVLLVLSGCSRSDNPAQPQASQSIDIPFSSILPYSGLSMGEVTDFVVLGPTQVDQLRRPVSELNQALVRDYESEDLDPLYGVEKYREYLSRINGVLSASQQETFGKVVAYHVDVVGFGKDFRHFLRLLIRGLHLTPEQVEQLKGFAKIYGERVKAVFEKVKQGELTREQARPEIKKLFESFVASLKGILTEEQLQKLGRILRLHRHGNG